MKTTLNTPIDLQTVLTIAFFKKIQVKPDVNLICTDWLRLPATSELKDVYHHIRKGTYLEIKKSSSNPFNYNLNIFYKKYLSVTYKVSLTKRYQICLLKVKIYL